MATSIYIFNQYYIDLLKKIKTISKKHKNKSKTAQKVLKTIKENYMTLDKSSNEYLNFLNESFSDEDWKSYLDFNITEETISDWFDKYSDKYIFIDITVGDITRILRDNYLCHHYCSVFYIFRNDITEEQSEHIVKILQTINNKELLEKIENDDFKSIITRLENLRNDTIKNKAGIDMKCIEDTSLGKLAKEILDEIDISKLKESMGEDGDVLKAIGDPNSGFSDLLTNVSKKMATKISNGELKQENLLQDAMKFASFMPGMFGQKQNNNDSNAPNMADIMGMMGSMMGGNQNNMQNLFKNMAAGAGGDGKKNKTRVDESKIRKMAKINKMREKLNKRREDEMNNNE
jgi:hypothetical protein